MRYWTIQPLDVWEQVQAGKRVLVDPDHPKYGGERVEPYDWLARALQRRLPAFEGQWLWWLYAGWGGVVPALRLADVVDVTAFQAG